MRMAAIGIIAAVIGGTAIYDNYDKKTNYQPVNARVTAVTEQCYLEKSERGVMTRTTSTSDLTRCEVADYLRRQHPKLGKVMTSSTGSMSASAMFRQSMAHGTPEATGCPPSPTASHCAPATVSRSWFRRPRRIKTRGV